MAIDSTLLSRRKFLEIPANRNRRPLAGIALPVVHGKDDDTTKIRIGRLWRSGNGSASQCPFGFLANGPTKIVAMADAVQSKLDRSLWRLSQKHKDKVDAPPEPAHWL